MKTTTDSTEINYLKRCIDKYVKDLVDSHPKIHMSFYGITLKKPLVLIDTSHVHFDHVMKTSIRFNPNDHSLLSL